MVPPFASDDALDCFCPGQPQLISLRPRKVQLLVLFEQRFLAEDLEDLLLSLEEAIASKEVLGQFRDIDSRAVAFGLQRRCAVVGRFEVIGEV